MINTDHPIRIAIAGLGFGESVHIPASLSNKNIIYSHSIDNNDVSVITLSVWS